MTEHLPADRIAECVCAGPAPEEERHLRECAQCAAEVARLQSALGSFRVAVREWSEGQSAPALERARAARPRPARMWFRWPVLVAAALTLTVAPLYKTVHDRQRAAQELADAQLLEQVDRDVSESVPSAMEPLSQLVSWNSAAQDSSQSSLRNGETR